MKKPTYKGAVTDMCKECIYDPHASGNWRQQTTMCTSWKCPLWLVRPTTTAGIPKSVSEATGLPKKVCKALTKTANFRDASELEFPDHLAR